MRILFHRAVCVCILSVVDSALRAASLVPENRAVRAAVAVARFRTWLDGRRNRAPAVGYRRRAADAGGGLCIEWRHRAGESARVRGVLLGTGHRRCVFDGALCAHGTRSRHRQALGLCAVTHTGNRVGRNTMEWLTYDVLRVIWWALLGVLLIGFAVMDGFDLGVGTLLPFVARTDIERRVMINSIGPTWEGNQVWFILGGGAMFAAFPLLYAAAFSGFYFAMLLILVALILRPVGFDFRNKLKNERWRAFWDYALFIGGFVP